MKLLTARFVIPICAPPIERGAVLFDGERILAVGHAAELRRAAPRGTTVEEVGDAALLPGFVNPHTHLELTCYHGRLDPAPLWQWFDGLLPMRRAADAAALEGAGVRDGVRLSVESGVTLVGDISRTGFSAGILAASPLRAVSFVELISGASQPPSNAIELREAVARIERDYGGGHLTVGVSPHAPYTVTPDDLAALLQYAAAERRPMTMHLLETPEEAEWIRGQRGFLAEYLEARKLANAGYTSPGLRGMFEGIELNDTPALFAHVNYVTDEEIDALAETGASVVWCPRAHRYYGHADHPWRRLIERGINVCVGTDSLASNDSLSILDELRFLASQYDDVSSEALLRLGTECGARALGLAGKAGGLRPGAWPDFCVLRTDAHSAGEAVDRVVRSPARVAQTWIAGERVHESTTL